MAASAQNTGNSNGSWSPMDYPSAMNQASQTLDNQSGLGSQYSNSILNQILQQPSATQRAEAAFHQQGLLSLVPNQHSSNSLIAAAVQQQLVASLASPGRPLLQPFQCDLRTSQRLLVGDLAGNGSLLSRSEREALARRFSASSNPGLLSLAGQSQADYRGESSNLSDVLLGVGARKDDITSTAGSGRQEATTQLPCQARGMAADHNSSTAYFEIPSYATHGQHLLCSHPTCRAAGVKFRYCLFCKKPVTKQNFRSRHLHSDLDKSKDPLKEGSSTVNKGTNLKRPAPKVDSKMDFESFCHPVGSQVIESKVHVDGEILPSEVTEAATEGDSALTKDVIKKRKIRKVMGTTRQALNKEKMTKEEFRKCSEFISAPNSSVANARDDSLSLGMVSRRRRWSSLLNERPSDVRELDVWLANLISVSDLTTPWTATESFLSDGTVSFGSSVTQQSRWNSILSERPADNKKGAMTSWLVKILAVSCPTFDAGKDVSASTLSTRSRSSIASNHIVCGTDKGTAFDGAVPSEVTYRFEAGNASGCVGRTPSNQDENAKLRRRKVDSC